MKVALLTVGDELLAGDTVNTNAAWLASRIDERGGSVVRVLTIPDDRALIARWVREWAGDFDAVVVTGGLGGTPDDVTLAAVADAFERELVVNPEIRALLVEKAEHYREEHPDLTERYEFDFDLDEAASLPEGGRPLVVEEAWGVGCVLENVYILPGIPDEMEAMFARVADEFDGDVVSETFHTPTPEGAMTAALREVRERFGVAVGSYPSTGSEPNRLKVTGTDPEAVADATTWLGDRVGRADLPDDEA
ncbi:competence/damage-inducible protein A [Halobium salinum]|uniref:Competence/damage-inducible protein A n=1 Tax=Halobium salinum TaxID=1364940 RepID=A0ABD5P8N9_9EURY|nr:competence/damage-inducible protein A [Halobium salinum]